MAAATMYVTPAGVDTKTGADWAHAMGEAEFEADLEANAEPGDIYYVKAGTYTLDTSYDSTAKDATAAAPISIIGVKAATTAEPPLVADWGSGADRPTFVCGANQIDLGDYYKVFNCIFTGTATYCLRVGIQGIVYNCKATNSSGTANRAGYNSGNTNSLYVLCEAISTNGIGIYLANGGARAVFCYSHDSSVGITVASSYNTLLFNIIDTCTTGISLAATISSFILANSIYSCTTGISATTATAVVCINNILDSCTDGFKWTTETDINFFAYNHQGNGDPFDMWDGVAEIGLNDLHRDHWVTSGDPDFTNEAAGDFSLEATSPCIDAGMAMTLGVG